MQSPIWLHFGCHIALIVPVAVNPSYLLVSRWILFPFTFITRSTVHLTTFLRFLVNLPQSPAQITFTLPAEMRHHSLNSRTSSFIRDRNISLSPTDPRRAQRDNPIHYITSFPNMRYLALLFGETKINSVLNLILWRFESHALVVSGPNSSTILNLPTPTASKPVGAPYIEVRKTCFLSDPRRSKHNGGKVIGYLPAYHPRSPKTSKQHALDSHANRFLQVLLVIHAWRLPLPMTICLMVPYHVLCRPGGEYNSKTFGRVWFHNPCIDPLQKFGIPFNFPRQNNSKPHASLNIYGSENGNYNDFVFRKSSQEEWRVHDGSVCKLALLPLAPYGLKVLVLPPALVAARPVHMHCSSLSFLMSLSMGGVTLIVSWILTWLSPSTPQTGHFDSRFIILLAAHSSFVSWYIIRIIQFIAVGSFESILFWTAIRISFAACCSNTH